MPLAVRPDVSPTREAREAILDSLYNERTELTRARRLRTLSKQDEEYLVELNAYIDRWEAPEAEEEGASTDVWRRLDALASSMLSLQARVERNRE